MSYTYSSKDVDLVVGGSLIAEFESIDISRNPRWEHDHSNTGSVSRIEQADKDYFEITINMKQTSPDNLVLNAYYVAGAYIPVAIRDKNGSTTFAAAQMSIEWPDTATFGKSELNDLAWMLKGNAQLAVLGGN